MSGDACGCKTRICSHEHPSRNNMGKSVCGWKLYYRQQRGNVGKLDRSGFKTLVVIIESIDDIQRPKSTLISFIDNCENDSLLDLPF